MNGGETMRSKTGAPALRSLVTSALAACAVALPVAARGAEDEDEEFHELTTYTNTIEAGSFYNSVDEFEFGDYTGLVDDDWYALGNVDIRQRSAFDADSAYYYRLRGLNLGLDSRYIDGEYRIPGLFGISALYDEIPKYQTDSAQTFFLNAGAGFLTLPDDWVGISNPTQIDPRFFRGSNIDHKRRTAGGEMSLILPSHFDFDASYTHQTKQGEKLSSAMVGLTGGNPRSINVPEPLDYTFHQIESHIRHTTDDFQFQLEYFGSGFDNGMNSLAWENPYLAGPLNPNVGYPLGVAQKGTMPDNWFHQVTSSGGFDLPLNSRIMLNTAFGWATQQDDFLPYTNNPLLFVDPALGLPRPDLDGKLETRLVTFRFVSAPLPKLGIDLNYRWNDRDNETPIDTYFRIRADSENQDPANARRNRPYSFEQHKVDADVSYQLYKRTKLTLLYEWEQISRNLQEVHENNEHTVGGKLVSHPNRYVNLGARFERSYRDRSSYDCVKPLVAGQPAGTVADPGCPIVPGTGQVFENQPQLRKYYMANLRRNDAHVWASLVPLESVNLSSHFQYIDDDYYKSKFGLTEYRLISTGADLSYSATSALIFHTFYSFDNSRSEMESVSFGGLDASFDPANVWSSRDKDFTHTAGAGFDYDVVPERLSFGIDYLFARSIGRVDTRTVAGRVTPPFPDNETELHDVSVEGNLQLTRNLSLRVGYLFEHFDSSDWATDLVCPACLNFSGNAAVVASGDSPPDYDAHLVSLSLIYNFW
jgi:MtrB/PioB family decaheme-associated outer membrane protein